MDHHITLVLVVALIVGSSGQHQHNPTSVEGEVECQFPFVAVGGKCIHISVTNTGSWQDMRDYCHTLQGDLVTFPHANFYMDLVKYITSYGWLQTSFWVGGSDESHEGIWTWIDGRFMQLGSPYWGWRSSAQYPQYTESYNCVIMDGSWYLYLRDVDCSAVYYPICEQ